MSRFAPYPVLLSKEAAFKHQRSPDEPGPRSRLAVSRDSAPEEPQACTLGELLLPRPPHLFPTLGYFAGPKLYIFVFLSLQGKWGQAAKRSRGPWTDTGPRSLVSQSYSLPLPSSAPPRCYANLVLSYWLPRWPGCGGGGELGGAWGTRQDGEGLGG